MAEIFSVLIGEYIYIQDVRLQFARDTVNRWQEPERSALSQFQFVQNRKAQVITVGLSRPVRCCSSET